MHIHTGNRILLIGPLCIRDPLHARTYITIEDGLHVHQKNTKLLVFLEASTSSQKAWSNFSVVFFFFIDIFQRLRLMPRELLKQQMDSVLRT